MKIIDLINKIVNGKELPKKIIYKNMEFDLHYADNKEDLPYYIGDGFSLMYYINNFYQLNDEVEIIENKPIEEIKIEIKDTKNKLLGNSGTEYTIRVIDKILINKINELVKEVNKLKEIKDE
jgi:hypothetical protein